MKLRKGEISMKKCLVILIAIMALLLSACMPTVTNPTGQTTTDPVTTTTMPPATTAVPVPTTTVPVPTTTVPAPTTVPTDPVSTNAELEFFEELFRMKGLERNPYACSLGFEYTSPRELRLLPFYDGGFSGEHEITDAEWAELSKKLRFPEYVQGDFNRLPKDKMEAELQAVFGISLEDLSDSAFGGVYYLECSDSYGFYQSGVTAFYKSGPFMDIKHNDDETVSLTYEAGGDKFIITLKPNGDSYQILSNLKAK